MAHLIISFFAAFAAAISVYVETASFGYAFLAYSGVASLVLLSAIFSSVIFRREDTAVAAS